MDYYDIKVGERIVPGTLAFLLLHGPSNMKELRMLVIAKHKHRCLYCRQRGTREHDPHGKKWNLDHKTPESYGGRMESDNIALSCSYCNSMKGDLFFGPFITEMRKLVITPSHLAKWIGKDHPATKRFRRDVRTAVKSRVLAVLAGKESDYEVA